MINGRELFAEISSEAVCEGGEVVGYFVRNNRMDTLEQMLCSTVTVKLPKRKTATDYADGEFSNEDLAAIFNTCRLECRVAMERAILGAGIKWEAE